MNLLCISNGHGEDVIALRILSALRQQSSDQQSSDQQSSDQQSSDQQSSDLQLCALPVSGTGQPYRKASIDIIGPTRALPSGGFLNRDPTQLVRDMQGGLISLTRAQLSAIKTWTQTAEQAQILAVGDIVPLIFAYRTGLPYHFIGTAKSEYWLRDEQGKLPANKPWNKPWNRLEGWSGSVYLPWERWLMTRPNCHSVFVRDALTAEHLQTLGIRAQYAGNPMMDGLAPEGKLDSLIANLQTSQHRLLTITLIPGSREPEAYENWTRILAAVPGIASAFPNQPMVLLGAIAPSLSIKRLRPAKNEHPEYWAPADLHPTYTAYVHDNITLVIAKGAFNDCLALADLAIATAGTATEQFVGLGKPAITLPGNGPQFTKTFATVQAKMLGPSIQMVNDPHDVGHAITHLLQNPTHLQSIHQNGKHRMGQPGAGKRIATQLLKTINTKK